MRLSKILVLNLINAKNLFYNKFIIQLYIFRALCPHDREIKIVLCSIWYRHTLDSRPVHSPVSIIAPDGHIYI